jgi:KipI family sensor histidine kinase inhibitor
MRQPLFDVNSKNKELKFVRSAGDDLLSVSVADPQTAQRLATDLRESGDWLEAVAGVDSVVVRFDIASVIRADAESRLGVALLNISQPTDREQLIVEIPVVYGGESGPDFDFVCEELGLSAAELVEMHCGEYTVDMLGFTPGFAYIGGLDKRLVIDRLGHPRQFIPAGSVGIAGGRTGLYSLPGPGGWPLIGRTHRKLFDAASDDPFTLHAGARVIFTAVDTP